MGAILKHLIEDGGIPHQQAVSALGEWEIVPIVRSGAEVGEVMRQGKEVHVAINKEYRNSAFSKKNIKDVLGTMLEREKFLTTKLPSGDERRKFVERFGFVLTRSDNGIDYFWLESSPYLRGRDHDSATRNN